MRRKKNKDSNKQNQIKEREKKYNQTIGIVMANKSLRRQDTQITTKIYGGVWKIQTEMEMF